jgi:hypothetical protein
MNYFAFIGDFIVLVVTPVAVETVGHGRRDWERLNSVPPIRAFCRPTRNKEVQIY